MFAFVTRFFAVWGLFVSGLFFSVALAQSTPVSIPTNLQGLYRLDMVDAQPLSPIKATDPAISSDDIQVVITALGTLCVGELTLESPILTGVLSARARWVLPESELSFELAFTEEGFTGIDVLSSGGTAYGRLEGLLTGSDTSSCGDAPVDTSDAVDMFLAAESAFSNLFPPGPFTFNQIGGGYDVFRYYQSTDIYLAVRDRTVFARGAGYGEAFLEVGSLDDLLDDIYDMLRPNTLPSFYHGTYQLALADTQPFSPIADGTELTFVITSLGQLCVGELALSLPATNAANTAAVWENLDGDLRYVLDLTRDDDPAENQANFATGEISFQSGGGSYHGRFEGDKTSLSTECADAAGVNPDLADINTLFATAEQQYPAIFPSGPQTYNQQNGGFVYRYYYESGVSIGVRDGLVYLNGGQFGDRENPLAFGTLNAVLTQLNNAPVTVSIPATVAGTYTMSFSDATSFSPFSDGTTAQVVINSRGELCLDTLAFGGAFARQSAPSRGFWESAEAGLNLSVELADLAASDLTLTVSSATGLQYSALTGTRTSLVSGCGSTAGATDMTLVNQLFTLAQQHYSGLFPAGTLSFNQINGNIVSRYYPATGMTLAVDGAAVSVRGGQYGNAFVQVGLLQSLIDSIIVATTPVPVPVPVYVYDLEVAGSSTTKILNFTPLTRRFEERLYAVSRPLSTDQTALRALVEKSLVGEVRQIDSALITVTVDSPTLLVFTAQVASDSVVAGSTTERDYSLTYTIRQR
ncbi:MAG: hypothetical protein Q7U82_16915 [Gammaproteobacteria bacterium]|nr:hypothetical protein [Gammaproteobacteria bacterium]